VERNIESIEQLNRDSELYAEEQEKRKVETLRTKVFQPATKLKYLVTSGVFSVESALLLYLVWQRKIHGDYFQQRHRYSKADFMRVWGIKHKKTAERALFRLEKRGLIEVTQSLKAHGKLVRVLASDYELFPK